MIWVGLVCAVVLVLFVLAWRPSPAKPLARQKAAPSETPPPAPEPIRFEPTGECEYEIVGESHYQDALAQIVGGKSEDGVSFECEALIVQEPDNPYDKYAWAVLINGKKVGHIPRDRAAALWVSWVSRGLGMTPIVSRAIIVGGWRRVKRNAAVSEGSFGVKLDWPEWEAAEEEDLEWEDGV